MIESAGHRMLRDAMKLTRVLGYTQREQRANLALLYYWGHQYDHLAPWGAGDLPLRDKAPSVRLRLNKTVVDTLNSHLFGRARQPSFKIEGDPRVDGALQALLADSRLATHLLSLGRIGMLTGTVVLGLHAYEGAIDWTVSVGARVTPKFGRQDRTRARELGLAFDDLLELDEVWRTYDEDALGQTVETWRRRTWTVEETIEYAPIPGPIRRAEELAWEVDVEASVRHDLGFVPAEWISNLPVTDDIDGAPVVDLPEFELEDEINYTLSQTGRGIRYNQEPTLALINAALDKSEVLKRGSHQTLDLKPDRHLGEGVSASAQLLEMQGEGSRVAMEYVQKLADFFYQCARVVIHDPDRAGGVLSGVALQRVKEPMLALIDEIRPQYGHGIARALAKALAAQGVARYGAAQVSVSWPQIVEPTLDDVLTLVTLLREARDAGWVTRKTVLQRLAPYMGLGDVATYIDELDAELVAQGTGRATGENRAAASAAAAELEDL